MAADALPPEPELAAGLVTDPVQGGLARREDASSAVPLVLADTVRELPLGDRAEGALTDEEATFGVVLCDAGVANEDGEGVCWAPETAVPLEGIPRANSTPCGRRLE